MYGIRYFYLALVINDDDSKPLLYFSPRGLITILLFLSISDYDIQKSNIVDEKVLLVIIIASMFFVYVVAVTFTSNNRVGYNTWAKESNFMHIAETDYLVEHFKKN